MSINDRILEIIHHYNLNRNSFSIKIGLSSGVAIGNIVSGRRNKPSYGILKKILDTFPVNANWLLTGKGAMLLDSDTMEGVELRNLKMEDLQKLLEAKDKIIALQEEKIKALENENDVYSMAEKISVQSQKIINHFERQITAEALGKAKQEIDKEAKKTKKD